MMMTRKMSLSLPKTWKKMTRKTSLSPKTMDSMCHNPYRHALRQWVFGGRL